MLLSFNSPLSLKKTAYTDISHTVSLGLCRCFCDRKTVNVTGGCWVGFAWSNISATFWQATAMTVRDNSYFNLSIQTIIYMTHKVSEFLYIFYHILQWKSNVCIQSDIKKENSGNIQIYQNCDRWASCCWGLMYFYFMDEEVF